MPLQLSVLLGIRRDIIDVDNKGEYTWNNDHIHNDNNYIVMYNRIHLSNMIKSNANSYPLDLTELMKQQFSEDKQIFHNSFFICLSSGESYHFDHPINMSEFRPKYFLLYNNICEHSIYDNKFLRILKIIPVRESNSEYVTLEFENAEFVRIQISHPNYLEFTLRSHTGELIDFHDKDENVIIDLSFKIIN